MPGLNQDRTAGADSRLQQGQISRREFLIRLGALPVAAMAAKSVSSAQAGEAKLPRIKFGKVSLSRLVCGTNPFNAGSHLSVFVNHEMRRYYTTEQILKTLRRCQEVGINCWQSGGGNYKMYRRFIDQGGKMHYLSINSNPEDIEKVARAGGIGIAHHGEATDRLFKSGKLVKIHDFLKRVRDAGLMVGVSTHMPAVIEAIEDKGWDVDYYMACVYERHRTAAELKKLLGHVPIPLREVYLQEDPPRMFKVMRQTKRPCLAFKILAAGRLSERKAWVEKAFRETFQSIKANDGVIVGIYDRYSDQPGEDAEYARSFSSLSGKA
ncbi:MAG: radical SAM protein [Planctomycetes bacterium]|nr:radical SAM protein [Planctomycetota bacterium]